MLQSPEGVDCPLVPQPAAQHPTTAGTVYTTLGQKGSNWPGTFVSQWAKGLGGPEARLAAFAHAYASLANSFR